MEEHSTAIVLSDFDTPENIRNTVYRLGNNEEAINAMISIAPYGDFAYQMMIQGWGSTDTWTPLCRWWHLSHRQMALAKGKVSVRKSTGKLYANSTYFNEIRKKTKDNQDIAASNSR